MTPEEVIAILGELKAREFSIRKGTDEILIYEGDLHGTGKLVRGGARIYNGKVRRFSNPNC